MAGSNAETNGIMEELIRDFKDFKGTTEKTEKNVKTEKKVFFIRYFSKFGYTELKVPIFRKLSDFSVVKSEK